jgi:hypothetical protein
MAVFCSSLMFTTTTTTTTTTTAAAAAAATTAAAAIPICLSVQVHTMHTKVNHDLHVHCKG